METNHTLVAHIISANGILHGYWATRVWANIRCRWTEPSAPGQPRPKPAQAENTGDWRWRERVVRPGYGGGSREESNHLPARQDGRNYDAFVDRRTASPEQGVCVLGSLPDLRKGQSMCNRSRRGIVVFTFQSRWVISCCWGSPLCSSHQGGVRICRSGSFTGGVIPAMLAKARRSNQTSRRLWGIVAPDRVYGARNLVSRF